ncbi:MAG TPA: cystathionine gamma-synthase [Aeromicrobium sp.]|nr:cystathionine gamma-synthase [Aeromicrobium sp.]
MTSGDDSRGFSTRAIHAGQEPDPGTGAVILPIHTSTTFEQDSVGEPRDAFDYSRAGNPTRAAVEAALASLEGGAFGRSFASGMAATDTALRSLLRPGDHVVLPNDVYGGTFRLLDKVLTEWDVSYTLAPVDDVDAIAAAVTPTTKVIWIETPTNPLLNIADIAAVAGVARESGAKLVVDNTFASPYLQQPLSLGADVVMHSTTKYLGGHSDVIGGALITDDPDLAERFEFLQKSAGAVPGPFDSYLLLRGIKTLAVRMERHCSNAEAVAAQLDGHAAVSDVIYPGLDSHPGHAVAAKQMRRFGGMISVRLAGGREAAIALCERTKIFTLAESLGGVESLIEHPAVMTHASAAGSTAAPPDDLVRISVGIEDVEDLLADLDQALA